NDFYETYMKDPALRSHVRLEVTIQQAYDDMGRIYQEQEMGTYADRKAPVMKKAKDDRVRYIVSDASLYEFIISLPPRVDVKLEEEIRRLEQEARVKMAAVYMDSEKANSDECGSSLQELSVECERFKKSIKGTIDP